MTEDNSRLDGNALGGRLAEVLGRDITGAPRGCQSCGAVHAVGAHRLYYGAGAVLRCPACGALALRLVALPDRYVLLLAGTWRLELARDGVVPDERGAREASDA